MSFLHFIRVVRVLSVCTAFLSPIACFHSVSDICETTFAEKNQDIDSAIRDIHQEYAAASNQQGRTPASVHATWNAAKWEGWAEEHLKTTQKYMDIVGPASQVRPLRKQVSHIADQWVVFHGYAQLADLNRMVETLQLIKTAQIEAQTAACNLNSIK